MSKAQAVADLRFGSRLSVFLRSLNILKLLAGISSAATKDELRGQINNVLAAAAIGTKLTPTPNDDAAIAWLQNQVANDNVMSLIWFLYSTFVKPDEPNVPDKSITMADLEAALDEYAMAA